MPLNRSMVLSIRIVSWRKAKGLTQGDIAKACGVGVPAVSQWESGKAEPTHDHLVAAVARMGLTMPRFYGRVPKARATA